MGWYTALACAGTVSTLGGFEIVNTMGTLMQKSLIGGQLVYPFPDADWMALSDRKSDIFNNISEIDARSDHTLTVSIDLGGMILAAGDEPALVDFEKEMPRVYNKFPRRLPNHAAFHSHLQVPVASEGRSVLPEALFRQPEVPIVDGRGQI